MFLTCQTCTCGGSSKQAEKKNRQELDQVSHFLPKLLKKDREQHKSVAQIFSILQNRRVAKLRRNSTQF
jgi:hypothetical protein